MHEEIPDVRLSAGRVETKAALRLALQVFTNAGAEHAHLAKASQWYRDPSFDDSNIVLAVIGERIVGVVRLVPRVIHRGLEQLPAVGISSVCVDPAYRGRGLSILLMERALVIGRDRGFTLAFLIARRALDYFYLRFGFAGVSAYERVSLTISATGGSKNDAEFRPLETDMVDFCQAAHDREYFACFGRMTRTPQRWSVIIRSLRARGLTGHSIWCAGQPVGYVIRHDSLVCELALTNEWSVPDLIGVLIARGMLRSQEDWLQIPSAHAIVRRSAAHDLRFMRRSCPYGGHMVAILNEEKLRQSAHLRMPQALSLPTGSDLESLHARTAALLGSWTPAGESAGNVLPFNIGTIDEV